MNERIKELAEKAELHALRVMSQPDATIETYRESFRAKFAELIVKECAIAADMAQDADCEYPGDYVGEYMGYGEEHGVVVWRDQ